MFDGSRKPSPRAQQLLPLFGAAVTLIFCVGLAITGIALATDGCDCGGALGPRWLWFALLGLGVMSGVLGLALLWRYVVRSHAAN